MTQPPNPSSYEQMYLTIEGLVTPPETPTPRDRGPYRARRDIYPGCPQATLPFPRLLEEDVKAAREEVERRRALQIPPATASNHRCPVNKTLEWRLFDRDCVVLLIQWDNGSDDTWEAEGIMHKDMAPLVIQCWRKQGGHEMVTAQALRP
ncbi:uncharacterized protein B0J16DRAFT_324010 [Fusarium flagelliforme]|uniref:uncharacterized protein n=1 Tax=Fusarium flagelliforme TaxID=2675880 RepID=UPI001E8E06AC|nr:uncharacterized protein B0J16DRAFT_324010 [Fusarium flagelliforme]KAH7174552.1 hypothetical protein B0J16DRAFT_324010 [Fusarium flagelliforme]